MQTKTTSKFPKDASVEMTTVPTACTGSATIEILMTGATVTIMAPMIIRRIVKAAAGTNSVETEDYKFVDIPACEIEHLRRSIPISAEK